MIGEKKWRVYAMAVSWFLFNPCLALAQQNAQDEITRYSAEAENAMAAKNLPAAASLKRYDDAVSCFDRALEIDPQSLEAVQFKELIAQRRSGTI